MTTALRIEAPAARRELRWKRKGYVVHISDGVDNVALKATSRPMADRLIAKLDFYRTARPDLSPGEQLERALFEIACWERFSTRRSRGGAR